MTKQLIVALVVACVLIGVFVFMTEAPPEKTPGSSWQAPALENLDRIDFKKGELELVVELTANGWRIREPLPAVASADLMEDIKELFSVEEPLYIGSERDATASNVEGHGFDNNDTVLSVTLYDDGREAASFLIGDTEVTPSGATGTWVMPDGADKIYRVNRNMRTVLDKELADWRDQDVLVLSQDQQDTLTAIEVAYAQTTLRFEKGEGEDEWLMTLPSDVDVDSNLIRRFVRSADTLRAREFADDVTPEEAGTANPDSVVTLYLGDDEQHQVRVGRLFFAEPAEDGEEGEELRYMQVDDGPVFAVRPRAASDFSKRLGDFRPREVLDVDQDAIATIVITDREGSTARLERNARGEDDDEATWRMRRPQRIPELNETEMRRLLTNLADVEAHRFADDEVTAVSAGFDAPRRVITLTLDDDTEHVVEIGNPVETLGDGDEEGDADHFARVDGGLVFELRDHKVRNLLLTVDDLGPEQTEED